jgi:hypothetical protein
MFPGLQRAQRAQVAREGKEKKEAEMEETEVADPAQVPARPWALMKEATLPHQPYFVIGLFKIGSSKLFA